MKYERHYGIYMDPWLTTPTNLLRLIRRSMRCGCQLVPIGDEEAHRTFIDLLNNTMFPIKN